VAPEVGRLELDEQEVRQVVPADRLPAEHLHHGPALVLDEGRCSRDHLRVGQIPSPPQAVDGPVLAVELRQPVLEVVVSRQIGRELVQSFVDEELPDPRLVPPQNRHVAITALGLAPLPHHPQVPGVVAEQTRPRSVPVGPVPRVGHRLRPEEPGVGLLVEVHVAYRAVRQPGGDLGDPVRSGICAGAHVRVDGRRHRGRGPDGGVRVGESLCHQPALERPRRRPPLEQVPSSSVVRHQDDDRGARLPPAGQRLSERLALGGIEVEIQQVGEGGSQIRDVDRSVGPSRPNVVRAEQHDRNALVVVPGGGVGGPGIGRIGAQPFAAPSHHGRSGQGHERHVGRGALVVPSKQGRHHVRAQHGGHLLDRGRPGRWTGRPGGVLRACPRKEDGDAEGGCAAQLGAGWYTTPVPSLGRMT
jgi:hypothetical protein